MIGEVQIKFLYGPHDGMPDLFYTKANEINIDKQVSLPKEFVNQNVSFKKINKEQAKKILLSNEFLDWGITNSPAYFKDDFWDSLRYIYLCDGGLSPLKKYTFSKNNIGTCPRVSYRLDSNSVFNDPYAMLLNMQDNGHMKYVIPTSLFSIIDPKRVFFKYKPAGYEYPQVKIVLGVREEYANGHSYEMNSVCLDYYNDPSFEFINTLIPQPMTPYGYSRENDKEHVWDAANADAENRNWVVLKAETSHDTFSNPPANAYINLNAGFYEGGDGESINPIYYDNLAHRKEDVTMYSFMSFYNDNNSGLIILPIVTFKKEIFE